MKNLVLALVLAAFAVPAFAASKPANAPAKPALAAAAGAKMMSADDCKKALADCKGKSDEEACKKAVTDKNSECVGVSAD